MVLPGSKRGKASERIAYSVLIDLGFKIIETHKKILINNVEVGEADYVAEDSEGNLYAVEVKAGKVDVTGIRQAYVNANLLKMRPLIISKGFADESAEELAKALGVKVIQLSDIFLVESEELEIIMREVIEDVLSNYLSFLISEPKGIKPEYNKLINTIISSSSFTEVADKLKVNVNDVIRKIEELRSSGILPKWARRFTTVKRVLLLTLMKTRLISLINDVIKELEEVKNIAKDVSIELTNLARTVEKLKEDK